MRVWAAFAAAMNAMRIRPACLGTQTRYRHEKTGAGELGHVMLGEQSFLLTLKQGRKNPRRPAFTKTGAF